MKLRSLLTIFSLAILSASCTNQQANKSHGPIRLGDSATIVTETDPENLKDGVADLRVPSEDDEETTQPAKTDSSATTTSQAQPANNGNGLTAAFKEVTIFLPNINAKSTGKADLTNARSATYTLTSGNLASSSLRASGGTVSKVSQRTQTVVALQDGSDKLMVENLGATSGWQTLEGNNGNYPLTSLSPSELEVKKTRPSDIRNAVQQAARKARLNRQDTQDWLNAVKNMTAANEAPGTAILKSVTWRIEGKDANGKSFNKEIRIDIPM